MGIVTIGGIPVYDALITDAATGMMKISLVDDPAVMTNFVAFDATAKRMMYSVQDEEKRLVRGVVMRADFPIYRYSPEMGEYYIIYKPDQIRIMAEKYLAESRQNDVNTMHAADSDVDGVQMVQYFIKGDGVSVEGFDDCADGSLFAEFHVTNDEVWDAIKDGTYKGFSLEGFFDLEPEQDVEKTQSIIDALDGLFNRIFKHTNSNNMSKVSRLKAALARAFAEFGSMTTDKGVISWDGDDDIAVGVAVSIEDADGNTTPAPDGEYKTDDNKVIVIVDGKVDEIKDAETTTEPETDPAPVSEEVEMKAKKQTLFSKIRAAFSESYDEKISKIYDAIAALGVTNSYIEEAGDDYAIVAVFDDFSWETSYVRYDISWDEDGNAVASNPVAVVDAFVPASDVNEGTTTEPETDPAPSVEEFNALKAENADLKAQIAELQKMSAAKPAHEEFENSGRIAATGNRKLDNLARIINAGR